MAIAEILLETDTMQDLSLSDQFCGTQKVKEDEKKDKKEPAGPEVGMAINETPWGDRKIKYVYGGKDDGAISLPSDFFSNIYKHAMENVPTFYLKDDRKKSEFEKCLHRLGIPASELNKILRMGKSEHISLVEGYTGNRGYWGLVFKDHENHDENNLDLYVFPFDLRREN